MTDPIIALLSGQTDLYAALRRLAGALPDATLAQIHAALQSGDAMAKAYSACEISSSAAKCTRRNKSAGAPRAMSSRLSMANDAMEACSSAATWVQSRDGSWNTSAAEKSSRSTAEASTGPNAP